MKGDNCKHIGRTVYLVHHNKGKIKKSPAIYCYRCDSIIGINFYKIKQRVKDVPEGK